MYIVSALPCVSYIPYTLVHFKESFPTRSQSVIHIPLYFHFLSTYILNITHTQFLTDLASFFMYLMISCLCLYLYFYVYKGELKVLYCLCDIHMGVFEISSLSFLSNVPGYRTQITEFFTNLTLVEAVLIPAFFDR